MWKIPFFSFLDLLRFGFNWIFSIKKYIVK